MPSHGRLAVAHMPNQIGRGTLVGAKRAHRIATHLRPCSSLSRVDKRRHELRWLIVLCCLAHELIPIGVTPYMNLLVLRQRRELPMLSCTVSTRPHRRTASRAPSSGARPPGGRRADSGPAAAAAAASARGAGGSPASRARRRARRTGAAFTTTVKGPRCALIPQASSGTAWALALGASLPGCLAASVARSDRPASWSWSSGFGQRCNARGRCRHHGESESRSRRRRGRCCGL